MISKFSWNGQICNIENEYSLQVTTNNRDLYNAVEKMCQNCVNIKDEINKSKNGWLDAKEEKPKDSSSVLIYTKEGGIAEGSYNPCNDTWLQFRWNAKFKDEVLYWAPLPSEPKEAPSGIPTVTVPRKMYEASREFHDRCANCKG